jgi:hypothetical protein
MEKSRRTIQPEFSAKESRSSRLMGSYSKGGTSMKIMSLEEEDGLEVVQKRYILEISLKIRVMVLANCEWQAVTDTGDTSAMTDMKVLALTIALMDVTAREFMCRARLKERVKSLSLMEALRTACSSTTSSMEK